MSSTSAAFSQAAHNTKIDKTATITRQQQPIRNRLLAETGNNTGSQAPFLIYGVCVCEQPTTDLRLETRHYGTRESRNKNVFIFEY